MTGKEKEWNEETKEEKVIGNGREMLKKIKMVFNNGVKGRGKRKGEGEGEGEVFIHIDHKSQVFLPPLPLPLLFVPCLPPSPSFPLPF